jgi:hypothetical protein
MIGMAMGTMPPPPKPTAEERWKTPFKRDTKVKVDVERLITCKTRPIPLLFRPTDTGRSGYVDSLFGKNPCSAPLGYP